MTDQPAHYYWDSCVFIAFLNDERSAYGRHLEDIEQFLDESRAGKCTIYCSTITLAEVTRKFLVNSRASSFNDFLREFRSAIVPIDPDPNTMIVAGHLRGMVYTKSGGERRLMTPDAIHIATALTLTDTYKVPLDVLHTFDAGKAKGPEGNGVPMIGFETWCEQCKDDDVVQRVIALKRDHPRHPSPRLTK